MSVSNVLDTFQQVHGLEARGVYVAKYIRFEENHEQEVATLAEDTCMHVDALHVLGTNQAKKDQLDVCMLVSQRNKSQDSHTYKYYFGGFSLHDIGLRQVSYFLVDDQEVKGKGAYILFLFLPCKEKLNEGACRTWDAWSLFSLKEIGWGPPAMQAENMAHLILQSVC